MSASFPLLTLRRRGSSLVITMIIMVGIVAMISLASDSLVGVQTISNLDLDRQRARFAAETVAAMVEAQLTERSGDLEKLKQNLDESLTDDPTLWWGLKGFCYDQNGNYDATRPGLWINRCLVRWRLEPVVVMSKTLDETGQAPNAVFTLNSEPDPDQALFRLQKAAIRSSSLGNAQPMTTDPGLFHYRIVTEAYALADGRRGNADADVRSATVTPWTTTGLHTCVVQAQRVVQLELINLFRYALFHAQEDARGDIDLQTGQVLAISEGSVHSNAAIYIRGGEFSGFMSGPDYHRMACGDDGHGGSIQPIILGSAAKPIDVVGVKGVFRMGKTANILAGVNYPGNAEVQSYANPSVVPPHNPSGTPVAGTWIKASSQNDLNGDHPTSTRHSINGLPFTSINDSRSRAKFQSDFKDRVRDQNNGGAVVTSLANIPELAGRPLEFQRMPDEVAPLYRTAAGTLTVRRPPSPNHLPLYYQVDPKTTATPTVGTTVTGFGPVGAHGMRLWWSTDYKTQDVDPGAAGLIASRLDGNPLAPPALAANDRDFGSGDGFHDREVKGKYLEWALFGRAMDSVRYYASLPTTLALTGLVIRERPAQLIDAGGLYPSMAAVQQARTTSGFAAYRQAYADYLKSQYVVLIAGRNITSRFFDDILTATEQTYREADFIVTEDEFVDARESSSLAGMYGLNPQDFSPARGLIAATDPTMPAAGAIDSRTAHKQNVLTLNVRRIQDFLARNAAAVDSALSASLELRDYFNGLIYVHRTRRSSTFNPVNGARYRWIAPLATYGGSGPPAGGIYSNMFGGLQMLDYGRFDTATGGDPQLFASRLRDIDGPLDATRCNVRIRGGLIIDGGQRARQAEIDWNHTATRKKLGTSGLSIVTPDRLYMWGDFNTTTHADESNEKQTTPCAIFADGVTALSAQWQDSKWQVYAPNTESPPRTYKTGDNAEATSYITSFVINNVPNAAWNANSFGTGGSADTIHLMEMWGGRDFVFRGSMVVLNEQRYSKTLHYYAASPLSNGVRVFETGNAKITFNADLLSRDGQPPFSPFGVKVTRVISTLNTTNN